MNTKSAKILIVEDEIQINRLIELSLISDGFYNVKKAFDGIDALNKIKENKPDLILLDVMLPEINGFEICKKIKNDPYLKNIQVIMLTAKNMEQDILLGFELGAVDYITKPFSNKILLARIKAHLSNIDINPNSDILVDDLKKVLTINDERINLTKFEYEIFKLLFSAPDVVFSRSQILAHLRGEDSFDVSERAIDVQIVNLRKKLNNYGEKIETIRGVGYKFNGNKQ